jgi:HlyD family secretion protein
MNTQLKKILIYIGGAIIVSAAVYKIWFSSEDTSIVVETTAVKTGTISTVITATGTVEPIRQVEVGTQVSGVIDYICRLQCNGESGTTNC